MYKTSGTYFSTSCKSVSLNNIVQHINQNTQIIGLKNGNFLGGPVVKISPSSEGNASSIPGQFGSVQSLIVSDSLPPRGLQHTRLSCPSPTPRACLNSCPFSWLCHPTISSSVVPFSSCLQSFRASGSYQMSQFFASGDHSIGVSASASVRPMNIPDRSPFRWTGWISLQSKGLSKFFSNTTGQNHQVFGAQLCLQSHSHIHT